MTDFTEMYQTRQDQERDRQAWEHDQWRRSVHQGAFHGSQTDLVPVSVTPEGHTYFHQCALACGNILATFDAPVLKAGLKSKLCERCLSWKQRQLTYQRLLLKHPEWRLQSE